MISLCSSRLTVRTPVSRDTFPLEEFERRNAQSLALWESKERPRLTAQAKLEKWRRDFEGGEAIRFLLFPQVAPELVVGLCCFTQITKERGSCYLGYQMDEGYEGQGLMTEALETAIAYMFEEQKMRCIMAQYMPSNVKSGRVLEKLRFKVEVDAKRLLCLNGIWQEHVLTSLHSQHLKK